MAETISGRVLDLAADFVVVEVGASQIQVHYDGATALPVGAPVEIAGTCVESRAPESGAADFNAESVRIAGDPSA